MSETGQSTVTRSTPPRGAALLIMVGTVIVILSVGGLLLLRIFPEAGIAEPAAPTMTITRFPTLTPTLMDQALVQRRIVAPPTHTMMPTEIPSPTLLPTVGSVGDAPSALPTEIIPTQQVSSPTEELTPVLIEWTQGEKNALSWMCQYEVGGMGQVRYDACLSVISTIRARYVYGQGLGTDVLSVLQWPNQFNINIVTDNPNATFISMVNEYQTGVRGSCNGYFYFDSVPGGPSLCVINGAEGQFLDFHNGW